jgi:dihydroorotase-like cyclic amidohydrolase
VVVKPGETIEEATVLIRDGFIQAVGKDLPIPADARVRDLAGTTIYAGFIDGFLTLDGAKTAEATAAEKGITSSSAGGRGFYGVPGDTRWTRGRPDPVRGSAALRPKRALPETIRRPPKP